MDLEKRIQKCWMKKKETGEKFGTNREMNLD